MVLAAHQQQVDEDALLGSWQGTGTGRGFPLQNAAEPLGGEYMAIDPSKEETLPWLITNLASQWMIAQVFSTELARVVAAMTPVPESEYGPLAVHEFGQLHAIVLVRRRDRGFEYLDPFYPAAGQPFWMTDVQLVQVLQGGVVLPGAEATFDG